MHAHAFSMGLAVLFGLGAGCLIGLAHFAGLARNLRLFQGGRPGLGLLLLGGRLLLTAGLLALLIRGGLGALGGGLGGFLLARHLALRPLRPPVGREAP